VPADLYSLLERKFPALDDEQRLGRLAFGEHGIAVAIGFLAAELGNRSQVHVAQVAEDLRAAQALHRNRLVVA